jgi:PAS domain S-box-containing protein
VEAEGQKLYAVLEMLPVYVVLLSGDYHVPFANRFFRERFGESHGKRCYEYLFHRTGPCENCETFKVMKTWAPHHWEWLGPDGRNYDIYDYPFSDVDGSRLILEVGIDITEQKRAHTQLETLVSERTRELRESESALRSFFDAPGDMRGIVELISGNDVRHVADNTVTAGFLGLTPEAMRNRLGSELGEPEEVLRRWIGHYEESRRTGKPVQFEYADRRGEKQAWLSATVNYLGTNPAGEPRFAYVVRDIIDRKKAEEASRESEARFRALAEAMPQIVWSADASGSMDYYNPRALEYGGVRLDELTGWNWESLIHPDDLPATLSAWQLALEKGETSVVEHRLRRADGEYRWHLTRGAAVRGGDGAIVRWIGTATDIHDLKVADEALRESEERLARAQEIAHLGSWELDLVQNRLTWSDEVYRIFGLQPQEFKATYEAFLEYIHPDDRASVDAAYSGSLRENRDSYEIEHRVVRKNTGEIRVVHEKCRHLRDSSGKIIRSVGMAHDITERRHAEDALRESEERYRVLVDSAPEAILVHHHGKLLYANRIALNLYGASGMEELRAHDIMKLIPSEELEIAEARVTRIDEGQTLPMREAAILRLDGTRVPVEVISSPVRYDGLLAAQALMRDITARKQAEERIAHLASFPEQNPNPVIELNAAGEVVYSNPATAKALGDLGLGNDPPVFLPGDFPVMLPRLLEGDVLEEVEVGDRVFLETITLNPSTRTTRVYASDITDRKHAEGVLHETSQYLENLITHANAPIIVWDPKLRITRFNRAFERLTGRAAREVVGKGLELLFPEETVGESMDHIRRAMTGERWEVVEIPIINKDGSVRTVLWNSATLYEADGNTVSSAIAQGQDITERKHAEEVLRETSQYLENLLNYANAPIIVWDPEFRITRFNHAFERLTGRTAEEVLGKPLRILFPPETVVESMEIIEKAMAGERWEIVEIPIVHRDGSIRTVLWNSATLYEADGITVSSAIAQGQDITDRKRLVEEIAKNAAELAEANTELKAEITQRKQAEKAVRNALSTLNAAMESTADAMLVVDLAGGITSHNQNFTRMWNMPESIIQTLDTRAAIEFVSVQTRDPDGFLARIQEISNHPARESFDMLELLDGRIIERYSKPQRIGNAIVGRVYSFRDVTERKRAEFQLIDSLNEKEVLLREIHHRVKNNLQLTTSLLDMTRMRTDDPVTGSILTDVMMKIQTMAQIHTRLYESKQFDRINMDRQIRDQVQALTNIYARGDREIQTEIDSPKLFLPLDKAIPCALALNEILSNAYKHAFKDRKGGTVKYSACEENGRIRFTIADNGIGLPRGFDLSKANTLGLKLVKTLVEQQLKGTLRIRRKKGTEVIVELPMEREEEHV